MRGGRGWRIIVLRRGVFSEYCKNIFAKVQAVSFFELVVGGWRV
jgi:hypothetical protein